MRFERTLSIVTVFLAGLLLSIDKLPEKYQFGLILAAMLTCLVVVLAAGRPGRKQ